MPTPTPPVATLLRDYLNDRLSADWAPDLYAEAVMGDTVTRSRILSFRPANGGADGRPVLLLSNMGGWSAQQLLAQLEGHLDRLPPDLRARIEVYLAGTSGA